MSGVGGDSNEGISLNLNPMLDVFSILITFLLMSFSTDPVNHDINKDVTLPESKTFVALDEVPTITVSKTEIYINERKVANIVQGDAEEKDRSQGAIFPVFQELTKLADASKKSMTASGGPKKKNPPITMEMDKDHRFKLMKRIMLSAQQAEFVSFKLMVSKEM